MHMMHRQEGLVNYYNKIESFLEISIYGEFYQCFGIFKLHFLNPTPTVMKFITYAIPCWEHLEKYYKKRAFSTFELDYVLKMFNTLSNTLF